MNGKCPGLSEAAGADVVDVGVADLAREGPSAAGAVLFAHQYADLLGARGAQRLLLVTAREIPRQDGGFAVASGVAVAGALTSDGGIQIGQLIGIGQYCCHGW